jgi:LysR family hca operon transcriptional activator
VLDDLETVELLHERIVVVLPQHHPLTRRKRIAARNLDDLPSVALECAHAPALHDVTETFFRHSGICRRVIMTADSVLGALQLVQEGHGFALLPESFEALLPYGVVVRTLDTDPEPTVSLEIAWKAGNTSRVVGEFVKLVRQCCADCDGAEQAARYRAALHQSGSGDSRLGL